MNSNIYEYDDIIEDLDISWIDEFEQNDKEYKIYYTEDISFIKVHYVYINTNNEIEKVKEDKVLLKTNGILQKEELLSIIKSNLYSDQLKYSLMSILKFNLNIEPIHLKNFLKNKNPIFGSQFLQVVNRLDTIKFEKSISMFHDINDIIIIFHKKHNNTSVTKKSHIKSLASKKTKKRI